VTVPLLSLLPPWTGSRAVLGVEEAGDQLVLAVFGAGGEVEGSVSGPRSGDLGRDLTAGLEALRAAGARCPRRAVLVTERVTAACLELPPVAGVSAEEAEGLVRFELEPLLPAAAPGGLACGWASADAGGQLLACGLPRPERDRLARAFRGAGLRLAGVYAPGSCAPAVAPALPRCTVVESGPGTVATARVVEGRVTVLSVVGADEPTAAASLGLELADPADPLVLVGPADPALREALAAGHPDVRPVAAEAEVSASLLGAAQHALGLPGGERVAGVPGRAPRPSLRARGPAPVLVLLAALVTVAVVVGLDVHLQGRLERARDARARLDDAAGASRARAAAARQLTQERDALTEEVAELRAAREDAARRARRTTELVELLDALAATAPRGLALDALEDGGDELLVSGRSATPSLAQAFLGDLEAALASRGLRIAGRRVTRDEGALTPSYVFEARLERAEPR